MIPNDDLHEEMRQFFRRLPNYYIITEDEQIELIWTALGKNQLAIRECFPNLKQALQRAISLGPAHHMVLQAVIEPGTLPWETDSTQALAAWRDAPGRSGSNGGPHAAPLAIRRTQSTLVRVLLRRGLHLRGELVLLPFSVPHTSPD